MTSVPDGDAGFANSTVNNCGTELAIAVSGWPRRAAGGQNRPWLAQSLSSSGKRLWQRILPAERADGLWRRLLVAGAGKPRRAGDHDSTYRRGAACTIGQEPER